MSSRRAGHLAEVTDRQYPAIRGHAVLDVTPIEAPWMTGKADWIDEVSVALRAAKDVTRFHAFTVEGRSLTLAVHVPMHAVDLGALEEHVRAAIEAALWSFWKSDEAADAARKD